MTQSNVPWRGGAAILVVIVMCLPNITWSESTSSKCEVVNKNCTARVGCGLALHNFLINCNTVINGESNNCTEQCTRALIALFSTDDNIGKSLTTCDCQGDTYCTSIHTRISMCATSVLEAMNTLKDSSIVVPCSLARWLCEADAHCQNAFTYYLKYCQALYDGSECTKSCNDSLVVLYRQSKAAKLRNCQCEGQDCSTILQNTQRLCFKNTSGYSVKFHAPHSTASSLVYPSAGTISFITALSTLFFAQILFPGHFTLSDLLKY